MPDVPDPEVPAKPSGDWVFLEVNPNGQWAWLEQATQLPISSAIADVLAEGGARVR